MGRVASLVRVGVQSCGRIVRSVLAGTLLAAVSAGCVGAARDVGRRTAAAALACPAERFDAFVPHSYNLGAGDQVHRGCGRDAIVHCASTSAAVLCRPIYVSPPEASAR